MSLNNRDAFINRLSLSYLQFDYERLVVESNPTTALMRFVFNLSKDRIQLSDNQIKDLLQDISLIKSLDLWDYDAEQSHLEELNNKYLFHKELKKLPEAEAQRYYKKIEESGLFDINK